MALLELGHTLETLYLRMGKRLLDLMASFLALLLLAPVMALLAAAIKLSMGSPVLFHQERPGLHGRPFIMIKFRTMTEQCDVHGRPLPDSERLTPLGRFLRSTSLDELPEMFNVLKGEMSLVGPRPLLLRYYPYFTAEEQTRFSVRPGVTGLAQISGRNDLTWDSRIAADIQYVQSCSLRLDLQILLLTASHLLTRKGLRVDPGASMIDFDVERMQRVADGSRKMS